MRLIIVFFIVLFFGCRRQVHCENATVFKSVKCDVEWEVEFEGARYPVDSLPENLKRDKNKIQIFGYHFYDDPRTCPCCGYKRIIIEEAEDEIICL